MAASARSDYPHLMRANVLAVGILSWLGLALAGCFGYVQGDGGGVVVAEPDLYLFGGYPDGGPARDYGRRGAESRGPVGHPGGHAAGGRGGGRR